jgi:hypothetical protein
MCVCVCVCVHVHMSVSDHEISVATQWDLSIQPLYQENSHLKNNKWYFQNVHVSILHGVEVFEVTGM